jgi:DNA replication protein DnaC
VLAIDDIGKEHRGRSELVEAMVDQVVRYRVSNSKPTFITTNLTPEQIQQGYGGYVMSLLSEQADFIALHGQDFRPQRREIARREADLGLTRPITVV